MKIAKEKAGKLFKKLGVIGTALVLAVFIVIPLTAFAMSNTPAKPTVPAQQEKAQIEAAGQENDAEENDAEEAENDVETDDPAKEAAENAALTGKAAITEKQATDKAIAANPGATVIAAELENENGTIVYAVDLKTSDGKVIEVKVDATSGAIIKTETDTENDSETDTENDNENDVENDDD